MSLRSLDMSLYPPIFKIKSCESLSKACCLECPFSHPMSINQMLSGDHTFVGLYRYKTHR